MSVARLAFACPPRPRPPLAPSHWRPPGRRPQARRPAEPRRRRSRRACRPTTTAIKDFTADFTQTYEGGVLRKKTTERGTLLVKKPGKMRWGYTSPEEKLFVSDGLKIYAWVPADRQVTVSALPTGDEPATPILFLVGRGQPDPRLHRRLAGAVPGAPGRQLRPGARAEAQVPDYESADAGRRSRHAGAAHAGCARRPVRHVDLHLHEPEENVGLQDAQFSFTIPRGADVVPGAEIACAASCAAAGAALLRRAALSGCAGIEPCAPAGTPSALEDYDRAVVEYEQALRAAARRHRRRGSRCSAPSCAPPSTSTTAGRRLAGTGKLEEALVELQIAGELNPANGDVDAAAARARAPCCAPRSRSARRQDAPGDADRECRATCRRPAWNCPRA